MKLIGPGDVEVAYQTLASGRIIIKTSLSANTTKTFTFEAGDPAASVTNPVVMTNEGDYYQLTNGRTGVRVLRPNSQVGLRSMCPFRGIRLKDGTWTAAGSTLAWAYGQLAGWAGYSQGDTWVANTDPVTTIIDEGPLRTTVKVHYAWTRPTQDYSGGGQTVECATAGLQGSGCIYAGGTGFFTWWITMEADSPVIGIEVDTDGEVYFHLPFNNGSFAPDQIRYRGQYADSVTLGRENPVLGVDDQRYRTVPERNFEQDGLRDYDSVTPTNIDGWSQSLDWAFAWVNSWPTFFANAGHYAMMYDKDASGTGADAQVYGYFVGRASRGIGNLVTGPAPYFIGSNRGITWSTWRRAPDLTTSLRSRQWWAIWVGDKATDLPALGTVTNIGKFENRYSCHSLTKYAAMVLNFDDVPASGAMYMDSNLVDAMIDRVRNGDTDFYDYLIANAGDQGSIDMIDAWADDTGAQLSTNVTTLLAQTQTIYNTFVNGHGLFEAGYGYVNGAAEMQRAILYMDACLADPLISATEKEDLKAAIALYSYILWDEDHVPLSTSETGRFHMGSANQPISYGAARQQYALYLTTHPAYTALQSGIATSVQTNLETAVTVNGVSISSPHYMTASAEGTINNCLQLQQAGGTDLFTLARMDDFAEFVMNLTTPPDPRYKLAIPFSAPQADVYYLVVFWHDPTENTVNLQINNGIVYSEPHSTGLFNATSDVMIGAVNETPAAFLNGHVAQALIGQKVPSVADRDEIWNDGAGKSYDTMSGTCQTDITAAYEFEESAGATAEDETTNNLDLTDHNTVGRTSTGVPSGLGNAATFNGTTQYFSRGDHALTSGGDIAFFAAAWVKLNGGLDSNQAVIGQWWGGSNLSWLIYYNGTTETWTAGVTANGTDQTTVYGANSIPRKTTTFGDSQTEANIMAGLLSTGFRKSGQTALANRLAEIWRLSGRPQSFFFGTTILKIDEAQTTAHAALTSRNHLGYMSVLRYGYGTENETVIWLLNGEDYIDHNSDGYERGSTSAYALCAPLMINWSTLYTPFLGGSTFRSMIIPESVYTEWDDSEVSQSVGSGFEYDTFNDEFTDNAVDHVVANCKCATSGGLNWQRRAHLIYEDPQLPIIVIEDTFSGTGSTSSKICQFQLMATGEVDAPGGGVTPTTRLETNTTEEVPTVWPSSSAPISLSAGLNKFGFVGQTWVQHSTNGIDFEVWTNHSGETRSAVIGNWGHSTSPTDELAEFNLANSVSFTETQHILRIQGTGAFFTVILPFRKGHRPGDLNVTLDSGDVIITRNSTTVNLSDYI